MLKKVDEIFLYLFSRACIHKKIQVYNYFNGFGEKIYIQKMIYKLLPISYI